MASLSPEARDELRAFVLVEVRQELAARERAAARDEWDTTAEAARLLGTTENAIRCRAAARVDGRGRRRFVEAVS